MLVGIWETNQIVFKQFPANVHMLYYLKTLENQRFFPGVSNEYKITMARNGLSLIATVIILKELWSISRFQGRVALRGKCPCLELFWTSFSRIWTEHVEIRSISSYLVQMRKNADQNNSEYGHFSRSVGKGLLSHLKRINGVSIFRDDVKLKKVVAGFYLDAISVTAIYG